jgi:glycosyltransferase involved in cell wall biosynthesis
MPSNGVTARIAGEKPCILFVPGFVADTYSEIEQSCVELCAAENRNIEFLWLVPDISSNYDNFARPESRATLKEPVYLPYLRSNNVPYIVGTISKFNVIENLLLFRRIFREHQVDAVYTHFGLERFWAAFIGKLFGKTIIWNEHWYSLGMRFGPLKRLFYRSFVDEFICVSEFIRRTLPRKKQVHTILNGIRPEASGKRSGAALRALRRQLGIDANMKVVLMVAAFTPQKRHEIALKLCEEILNKRKDVMFCFLGDGVTRNSFLAQVKERGLRDHILAPGYVRNVDDYYSVADICILTSYCEGFGYTVLEAMRYGCAMVAFDTGAPPELIRSGETGFVVPEGDLDSFTSSMMELIDNPTLRLVMGKNARRAVRERHSRELWIARVHATLGDIVTRRVLSKAS